MHVAGAAIQRAGKIVDALSFYEWAEKHSTGSEVWQMRERLIKCRQRRALLLEREGKTDDAAKVRSEVNRMIQEMPDLGDPELISEFPELDEKIVLRPQQKTTWTAGEIRFLVEWRSPPYYSR